MEILQLLYRIAGYMPPPQPKADDTARTNIPQPTRNCFAENITVLLHSLEQHHTSARLSTCCYLFTCLHRNPYSTGSRLTTLARQDTPLVGNAQYIIKLWVHGSFYPRPHMLLVWSTLNAQAFA